MERRCTACAERPERSSKNPLLAALQRQRSINRSHDPIQPVIGVHALRVLLALYPFRANRLNDETLGSWARLVDPVADNLVCPTSDRPNG